MGNYQMGGGGDQGCPHCGNSVSSRNCPECFNIIRERIRKAEKRPKDKDKIIQVISAAAYRPGPYGQEAESIIYGLSESGKIYQFISASDGWQLIAESPEE